MTEGERGKESRERWGGFLRHDSVKHLQEHLMQVEKTFSQMETINYWLVRMRYATKLNNYVCVRQTIVFFTG